MIRSFVFGIAFLLTGATAQAQVEVQSDFLKDYKYETRLGMGAMLSPDVFLVQVSGEMFADRFFSFGPMMQFGLGSDSTYIIPTLGGRFRIPIYPLKRVEASVQMGAGALMRAFSALTFYSFAYEFGMNIDAYPLERLRALTVGFGWLLNVTSASSERSIWALSANASYHF